MATPIKLDFQDDYNPLKVAGDGRIRNGKDLRDVLVAILVDGITELGGSLGWTLVLDEETGFVLRNAHPTQPKDWHFYTWDDVALASETEGLIVRCSDSATGLRSGSGFYPPLVDAADMRPMNSSSSNNWAPMFLIATSSSSSENRGQFTIYATPNNLLILNTAYQLQVDELCDISDKQSTRLDTEFGTMSTGFGHNTFFAGYFKPNGAWADSTILVAHGRNYSTYAHCGNPLFGCDPTDGSYSYARTYVQKDGDGNDGFFPSAIRAPMPYFGFPYSDNPSKSTSLYYQPYYLTHLPTISNLSTDSFFTTKFYVRSFNAWLGELPGFRFVGIKDVPAPTYAGDQITVGSDTLEIYRTCSVSSGQSPIVGVNITEDWDV